MYLKKSKILFITPTLGKGGAEKNIKFLVENLNKDYDVVLIIQGNSNYKNNSTKVHVLNKKRFIFSIIKILGITKKENPDIIFSSSFHINLFLGTFKFFRKKTTTIVRETNIPSQRFKYSKTRVPFFLKKYLLLKNDIIICQSHDMHEDFIKHYSVENNNNGLCIINNPIKKNNNDFIPNKLDSTNLISIGSLTPKKGYERVFNYLNGLDLDYKYNILGTGNQLNHLKKLVYDLELDNKISFLGIKNDIYPLLKKSKLFILGSHIEGFPNVILESLSVGIPCIIFEDSLGGHKEMIIDGFNGYICKNRNDFQNKILLSLKRKWDYSSIISDVYKRYNKDKILDQYKKIINDKLIH